MAFQVSALSMLFRPPVASERDTRGLPRALLTYDQLLSDWRQCVRQVGEGLALNLYFDDASESEVDAYLEPALRHHVLKPSAPPEKNPVFALASSAYDLATARGINASAHEFDALREKVRAMTENVAPWSLEICALRKKNTAAMLRVQQLEEVNAGLLAEIARVKATVSWQVTKPLRGVWNLATGRFSISRGLARFCNNVLLR
jgi:hypothetical protein